MGEDSEAAKPGPTTDYTQDLPTIPRISKFWLKGFRWTANKLFRHKFNALRYLAPPDWAPPQGSLIIYANHPGWWDPIVATLMAERWFPDHRHYFPMDAEPLSKQIAFDKIGFLPVDRTKPAGSRSFLRTAKQILQHPNCVIWITPQGLLTDPRVRPIEILPGLALIANHPDIQMMPLALEHTFWNDSKPETLVHVDHPHPAGEHPLQLAEQKLTTLLDQLSSKSCSRDSAQFQTLVGK